MRNEADALVEAGGIKATPIRTEHGGTPFLISKGRPISLDRFQRRPARARGHYRADSIESLCDFIRTLRSDEVDIRTVAFWRLGKLTVFLDFHHDASAGGWCEFKATCWCRFSTAKQHLGMALGPLKGTFKPKK